MISECGVILECANPHSVEWLAVTTVDLQIGMRVEHFANWLSKLNM